MHLDLHTRNIPTTANLKELAMRKAGHALDRFAHRIGRLTVRLYDLNGPKGGIDVDALALVELREGTRLVVRGTYASPNEAINGIVERVRHAVQRSHDRLVQSMQRAN